jgi:hypothetical protein
MREVTAGIARAVRAPNRFDGDQPSLSVKRISTPEMPDTVKESE